MVRVFALLVVLVSLLGCSGAAPRPQQNSLRPPDFVAEAFLRIPQPRGALLPVETEVKPVFGWPEAPELAWPALLETCSEQRFIVVRKKARRLELRCGDMLAASFDTSLGFAPEGAKRREGDGRTPEGDYFISGKWSSQYHRSLQLAYPNEADAVAGLREGAISQGQHDAIVRAVQSCRQPPQNTPLGSLIQIHGAGGGPDVGDWTLGCIAVDNPDIEAVYAFHRGGCEDGTPRTIVQLRP